MEAGNRETVPEQAKFRNFGAMNIPSKYVEEAVEQFSSLPGIGKRTALRLVLNLLKRDPDELERFGDILQQLKTHVQSCSSCGNISDTPVCSICSNEKRNHRLICVVEDIRDVMAIESTGTYQGIYHVLGGIISPMDGIGPNDLFIQPLVDKCMAGAADEIILALSPTMEGDTTNFSSTKNCTLPTFRSPPFHAELPWVLKSSMQMRLHFRGLSSSAFLFSHRIRMKRKN